MFMTFTDDNELTSIFVHIFVRHSPLHMHGFAKIVKFRII